MKRVVVLLVLSGLIFPKVGLSQKMLSDYYEEAIAFSKEEKYDQAIASYRYIMDRPKSDLYPLAFYNMAGLYYSQKKYDSAILLFRHILNWGFDDRTEVSGGIMSSPYANFKHEASYTLHSIYYLQERFDSALHYLALADTVYTYQHFCGNAFAEKDIYFALQYAEIYQRLYRRSEAISALLKVAVETGLANNSAVLKKLKTLLKREENRNFKKELDQALAATYLKPTLPGEAKAYYFRFLNTEIYIPPSYKYNDKDLTKAEAIKTVKETPFYSMISGL